MKMDEDLTPYRKRIEEMDDDKRTQNDRRLALFIALVATMVIMPLSWYRNYSLWEAAQNCRCGSFYLLRMQDARSGYVVITSLPAILSTTGLILTAAGGGFLGVPLGIVAIGSATTEKPASASAGYYVERFQSWVKVFTVVNVIALIIQGLLGILGLRDRFVPNGMSYVVFFIAAILFIIMMPNTANLRLYQ